MTRDELLALPTVVDVVTAARAYGIGRSLAYAMAADGTFPVPVLRLGRHLRVRTAHLIADLAPDMGEAGATKPHVAADPALQQVPDA